MSDTQITVVTIAGVEISADKAICPSCNLLDLDTQFTHSPNKLAWSAKCSKGHYWGFRLDKLEIKA